MVGDGSGAESPSIDFRLGLAGIDGWFRASPERTVAALLCALLVGRLAVCAIVPLVPDEAYYLLWSQSLSAGYLDHPPMIAFWIRAGTLLFGDTPLGARLLPILAVIPTSWLIWQSASLLITDRRAGPLAALIFNVTLYGFFGMALATPDAPVTLFAAAMFYSATQILVRPTAAAWIGLGVSTGLAFESKYSALLLAVALAVAILATPPMRRQLRQPWPWLALLVALLLFAPNLGWNVTHDFATFAKQGGRVVDDTRFSPAFLIDLFASQIGLFTPLLLGFGVVGVVTARAYRSREARRLPLIALALPFSYFVFHALRARVEGNWPGFLYPVLSVTAAAGLLPLASPSRMAPGIRRASLPMAAALILLVSLEACLVPFQALGHLDPVLRMTGGWSALAASVEARARSEHVTAIFTDNYQLNAELRLFIHTLPVEQWTERDRPGAITDTAAQIPATALYIKDKEGGLDPKVAFGASDDLGPLSRSYRGTTIARYESYWVATAPDIVRTPKIEAP